MTPTSVPARVKCPHPVEGKKNFFCWQLVAEEFAGFLRTTCRRCHRPIVAVTTGRTEIDDVDGVIVVTVTKEAKPAA